MDSREYYEEIVKSIYSKVIDHYGSRAQMMMALEEMSELTKELCKLVRNKRDRSTGELAENLAEEIADVEIMLEQLKIIFGNEYAVETRRAEKLQRLLDRINAEE